MPKPPRVRKLTREEGERVDIHRFPNFSVTGSITGMRNKYYGHEGDTAKLPWMNFSDSAKNA